jgi:hypothetical protein
LGVFIGPSAPRIAYAIAHSIQAGYAGQTGSTAIVAKIFKVEVRRTDSIGCVLSSEVNGTKSSELFGTLHALIWIGDRVALRGSDGLQALFSSRGRTVR